MRIDDGTNMIDVKGRTYGLHAVGTADGPVVFHHHGGPSSRLEVELFRPVANALGLRIIGIDRPGMGLSAPSSPRTFALFADDVVALADRIGIARLAFSGWSAGGPWALGCAHFIPADRLVLTAAIAGGSYGAFGANWAAPYQDQVDRLGGFLALHVTPAFTWMYELLGWDATKHSENYWSQLMAAVSESDRAVCAQPGVKPLFLASSAECFRQGADGLVADALALYNAWDFNVRETKGRVQFWQGEDDRLVVPAINHRIAEVMPHATWNSVKNVGHFVAVKNAYEIFGGLRAAF